MLFKKKNSENYFGTLCHKKLKLIFLKNKRTLIIKSLYNVFVLKILNKYDKT